MASITQLGEGSHLGWLGPHMAQRSPWSSLTVKWPSSLGLGTLALEVWSIFGYLHPSHQTS